MKKIKTLMMVFLCGFIMLSLTGCGNKQAIASSDFKSKMESKGFDVQDATNQFAEYDYIKQVYIAINNNSNYQIEFYETLDADGAKGFYETNKEIFENEKESSSAYTSVDLGNHSKFSLTTGGKFKVVSRIDNTIIYLNVDEKNKSEVKNILDELGY